MLFDSLLGLPTSERPSATDALVVQKEATTGFTRRSELRHDDHMFHKVSSCRIQLADDLSFFSLLVIALLSNLPSLDGALGPSIRRTSTIFLERTKNQTVKETMKRKQKTIRALHNEEEGYVWF